MNAQKSFQQKFLGSSILCNYHGCNVGSTLSSMVVSSVIIECCKLCPSYCRLPSADRIEYLFPSLPWYLDPGPALLSMTGLGCSKTDNYPVLRRVKLQPILMRNIRRKYEQNLIRVFFYTLSDIISVNWNLIFWFMIFGPGQSLKYCRSFKQDLKIFWPKSCTVSN